MSPPRGPRLSVLATLVLALIASVLSITLPAAADTLISQGRTATASSSENTTFVAPNVTDGDNGTRWASAFADPQWVQIDLGATATVSQVVLSWEAAYGRAFQLQVSGNGTDWNPIYTTADATGGTQTLNVAGSGRYIRMYGTQRATQYGYSLWEFQVIGAFGPTDPPPGGDRLLSYGRTGAASTSQNDGACWQCGPDKAFDRDPASRWATSATNGWTDPGWISVDLGATAQIKKVVLQWDAAYAKSYQLQVSANGTDWTPVYSTTAGPGFKQTLNVTGTGRYVRMYGTQRNSAYGYSLWEFQVWGTGGAPITPPALPQDPPDPPTNLVFQDEFNTAAGTRPNAAKWNADAGTGQNGEQQYYTNNDNTATDGAGNLVIEARKQTPAACPNCPYTSGRINTGNKFNFTYGTVEARIKVPKGNGFWPAFWMMGADFLTGRPWPYNGEVDILEVLGKD
ncbi:MAG: discoidin domain-containing protein, partial [Streptosporangiaceae bacterium]